MVSTTINPNLRQPNLVTIYAKEAKYELLKVLRSPMYSVSTVVFNINPLLRFDGYYMLSDLVDIPNLHQRATQQLRFFGERYLFGLKKIEPLVGGRIPRIKRRTVLLPLPLWPMITTRSSGSTSRQTSSSTNFSSNRSRTWRSSTTGGVVALMWARKRRKQC